MNTKRVTTNGIHLNVVDEGPTTGPLLLFLHGFPEFSFGWRKQIEFFSSQGYRVIAPDQRGYNLSDQPSGPHAYAMSELMKDIVGLIEPLLKETGQSSVFLVGHDWGGAVSWNLVTHYPHLFKKLIAINMPHPIAMLQAMNLRQLMRSWYMIFFQIPSIPEFFLKRNHFAALRGSLIKTSIHGTFTREEIKEYMNAWSKPGALTGMLNWYRAIRFAKKLPKVKTKISLPVLILWGKKDQFLGAHYAEESLKKCANAKLIYFEDATHWLHLEKPTEVNENILQFIRE